MKLHFQQSGGFAGLVRGCDVRVEDLPAKLARLATELGGGDVASSSPDPAARDDIRYQLSIVKSGQRIDFEAAPSTLPERFEPLFEYLVGASKPTSLR
jgi:hypothetical protein